MKTLYGFAGKILYVNLSTREISAKPLDVDLAERFIGGMGINSWLLSNLVDEKIDPLSPKNVLIFGVGPLVGTICPGAPKVYVASLSPDGFLSQSSAGHSMGIMMKYAGYDHLIIAGRSERPTYIRINDDEVEICDAHHLWGRDTWSTTDRLRNELDDYWVDCIGPAGERKLRYSIIMCSKRSSFNKTGPGTIMAPKESTLPNQTSSND
jgi:aldehyde:ferredoxin oxidoreductase